ncbi:MAG: segregation/condensation protein A [Firmicutes bacterium]|nr:segregation/condensation protein A [Bacillota bacterium]
MAEYQIRIPVFEGPFALLFHLIEQAEVDIYDISLSDITAQYLGHLQAMRDLNLDVAADFLVMAATLLKLKSKKLLPCAQVAADVPEEMLPAIASEEELVQRLLEYRYFHAVSCELRFCEQAQKRVFVRSLGGDKTVLVNPAAEEYGVASVSALLEAFQFLLQRQEPQPQEIVTDEINVQDKMKQVLRALSGRRDGLNFHALLPERPGVTAIIVTFFALLELIRLRKISVWQDGPFGTLLLRRNGLKKGAEGGT